MKFTIKNNKSLSTGDILVSSVHLSRFHDLDISDILERIHEFREKCEQDNSRWIKHPLSINLARIATDQGAFYYIEPNNQLNKLFSDRGTLFQKIHFLSLIGLTDAIERNLNLRDAVIYEKFCHNLEAKGINNPSLSIDSTGTFKEPIKRIHAVHYLFLDDPEVSAGLHIFSKKNTPNDKVLFVCTPELLDLSLAYSMHDITLIIDGHWEHNKRSLHGVWDMATASDIAIALRAFTERYPNKISNLRLLGCEAGRIAPLELLPPEFNPRFIIFKDGCFENFWDQDMAEFRNRSIYFSQQGEFPYDVDSLAGQIMHHLSHLPIKITAAPSFGYPYPAELISRFNIGSDGTEWRGCHYWKQIENVEYPSWYQKLLHMKSNTVILNKLDDYSNLVWPL